MQIPVRLQYKMSQENGFATPEFSNFLDTLVEQMQVNLSDDGFNIPRLTTDQISEIENDTDSNTTKGGSLLVFNTDQDRLFVRINNGTFRGIRYIDE